MFDGGINEPCSSPERAIDFQINNFHFYQKISLRSLYYLILLGNYLYESLYVAQEHHYGENVWVTRKGAIRARVGDFGIVPGSMGERSFIVRGLGNPESFCSSSHGAGRKMSRTAAEKQFTVADMVAQTQGVICRKDKDVIDEIPGAYKDIDQVMANQADLTEILHKLKQVVCVKG